MNDWWREWLVDVPEYDAEGVAVQRFVITQEMASFDKLRAALNPQRGDRTIEPGTFTRFLVDGDLWMTDTPAEIRDLMDVDMMMRLLTRTSEPKAMLIVGLGLGLVLNRAIRLGIQRIDVVEKDQRVLDAVAPHYHALAKEHDVELHIWVEDIHRWQPQRGSYWDIGFFDIWLEISMHDRDEVKRLRDRFRNRLGWFGAWAQDERNAQAKRIRTGRGFY